MIYKIDYETYKGETLLAALRETGASVDASCGGRGTCGKCKVKANGQEVLSCQHRVVEDLEVELCDAQADHTAKEGMLQLPEGFVIDKAEEGSYGVAVDLGTTTVVVMLWDLAAGKLLDVEAVSNPQRFYGADVMARISFVMGAPWNLKRLQSCLVNEVNQVTARLAMKHDVQLGQIRKIVAVGNTTMSHLFLGEDVRGLAGYPFQPAFTGSVTGTAKDMGLAGHEEAEVYVAPNLAGHVGSDITAGVLASGYLKKSGHRLLLDIGTNGEIFLATKGTAWCCSTAAGPAFEGSALHQGMRAAEGAIYKVDFADGNVTTQTIGGSVAKGICGSGIIDALAAMLEIGAMDRFGTIEEDFVLAAGDEDDEDVVVTQQDVREVQMAKGAIAAGVKALIEEAGLQLETLDEIGVAGAFGSAIDMESGMKIGLLPSVNPVRISSLGNAAGLGASMMLLSESCRKEAEALATDVNHVELANSLTFQTKYIEEMNF